MGEHYLTRTLATGTSVTVSAAVPTEPAPADPPRPDPLETDITEWYLGVLRELAEAGDAAAQTELGERYEDGRGVVQDYEAYRELGYAIAHALVNDKSVNLANQLRQCA